MVYSNVPDQIFFLHLFNVYNHHIMLYSKYVSMNVLQDLGQIPRARYHVTLMLMKRPTLALLTIGPVCQ